MKTTAATTATRPGPNASDQVLVDPKWLQAHLSDPHVRVVEVDVTRPLTTSGTSTARSCGTSTPT